MKSLSTIVLVILISAMALKESKAQSGFGGPALKISSFSGGTGLLMGGFGAAGFGNYYFGGGGFGLTNPSTISNQFTDFGYGGLLLGYKNEIVNTLGIYGQSFIAWGGGEVTDGTDFSVFMLEPEVGLSFSPSAFFTLRAGASRRMVVPTSGSITASEIAGNAFVLSFVFGLY
ncbi:MAG: hypothetical protein JXQ87_17080 [Bacteroidia bacterium]